MKRVVLLVILLLVGLLGCDEKSSAGSAAPETPEGAPEPPSEAQLKAAILKMADAKKLKANGIEDFSETDTLEVDCGAMDGNITDIVSMGATEWGKFNPEGRYWPVKVSFEGVCVNLTPNCGEDNNELCPPKDGKFKAVKVRLKLVQDDFGEWQGEAMK